MCEQKVSPVERRDVVQRRDDIVESIGLDGSPGIHFGQTNVNGPGETAIVMRA